EGAAVVGGTTVGALVVGAVDCGCGPTTPEGTAGPAQPTTSTRASSGSDRRVLDVMSLIRAAARSG
ncbi:MAG: hypothetical protein ACSLFN_04795, partial [Candidatus Limnocylindrales bacterium]